MDFDVVPTRRYNVNVQLYGRDGVSEPTHWHLGSKSQEELGRLEETLVEAFGLSGFEIEAKPQHHDFGVLVEDLQKLIGDKLDEVERDQADYAALDLRSLAVQKEAQWHALKGVENALTDLLYEEQAKRRDSVPEGHCVHGVYVGGCGIDWMCGACEDGRIL